MKDEGSRPLTLTSFRADLIGPPQADCIQTKQPYRQQFDTIGLKFDEFIVILDKFRPRRSAWENSCASLTVVGLHENWTLALRCQVSGVSSENVRAGLKPET
ncbi:MAG: hypothetical protein V3W19_10560 [Desulfatiglandales bacterium]